MLLKIRRLLVIYTVAALVALSAYAWAAAAQLEGLRLGIGYASARAFEEAVTAVEGMSAAFRKLAYAGDEALGKSLCAQAYADALAAEAALSALPFPTQELEKLQGYLGRAGDYAGSLCALTALRLPEEHRAHLRELGEAAADFAAQLREMQRALHEGSASMDTRERRLQNVGGGEEQKLSALLLGYESGFAEPAPFAYEGRYSPEEKRPGGSFSVEQSRALAAKAAGVEPRELREEYEYEGPDGRRCYSAGGLLLGVSNQGLEFMGQSRLVSGARLSREAAREKAEAFLALLEYPPLTLCWEGGDEQTAAFRYAPTQDGVPRPDDALRISVALDDGSIYAFDATRYRDEPLSLLWAADEDDALATLPAGVEAVSTRRVIRRSPGGADLPCWEILCAGDDGGARVYVDASTGRQCAVELEDAAGVQ